MSYRDSAQEIINFADRGALASCINNGVEFLLGVETDDAGEGDKVDFYGEDKEYRISCMDVTDSICRAGACASLRVRLRRPVLRTTFFGACAAILSPHIANFR